MNLLQIRYNKIHNIIKNDAVIKCINFKILLQEDKPVYEQKIVKTIILNNPFDDIVPRVKKKIEKVVKVSKKKEAVGVK